MKFLIIRFSSIGDIVLTSPVVRCLKKQVAGAEVHFLVRDVFKSIVEFNPYIDKVHVLAHSWELMIEELMTEDYDCIIDLHHNLRSLRVKKALNKKSFSFHKLNIEKYLLTAFKINVLPRVHIVDRYMDTVKSFGVINDGTGLDFFIGKEHETKNSDIPASHSAGFIACVIGAAHYTKRWPAQKWKEFCQKLNHPVILLGGKDDLENANAIAASDPVKIYNACGKFSINESADLVRKAKLVVSNDTGLMHVAAAFKRPMITLWGNTVPRFGMYPYYGEKYLSQRQQLPYEILEVNHLWCRPCSKIGYNKCPLGHFKCMERIEVESLFNKVAARL